MGFLGALKRLNPFRGSVPRPQDPEYVDVPSWWARIHASQKLAESQAYVWAALEEAVDGRYPDLLAPTANVSGGGNPYSGRIRSGDQLDVNLMGRAMRKRTADYYDRFPSLKFSRRPSSDGEVVEGMETLAEKLLDEGG